MASAAPRASTTRRSLVTLPSFRWALEHETLSAVVEHDSIGGDAHHLELGEEVSRPYGIVVVLVYHDCAWIGGIADDRGEYRSRCVDRRHGSVRRAASDVRRANRGVPERERVSQADQHRRVIRLGQGLLEPVVGTRGDDGELGLSLPGE